MGMKTMCHEKWKIPHFYASKRHFKLTNVAAITVPPILTVGGAPTTAVVNWPSTLTYIGGQYILPTTSSTLVFGSNRSFEVQSIAPGAGGSFNITIRNSYYLDATEIAINADVKVYHGQELKDCDCPSGTVPQEDGPLMEDMSFYKFDGGTQEICGDDLDSCQNTIFPFTYTDENNCLHTVQNWYNAPMKKMLSEHKTLKKFKMLHHPIYGLMRKISKYGMEWNWADPNVCTLADVEAFNQMLIDENINEDSFVFWAENKAYSAWMRFVRAQGALALNYTVYNPMDCKEFSNDYCAYTLNGIKYVFYLERAFTDKNSDGDASYINKGIGFPMGDRTTGSPCTDTDKKAATVVYFQAKDNGTIENELIFSDGYLNSKLGIPHDFYNKDTYGIGCKKHRWAIFTKMTLEVHEPDRFVNLNGFTA
jgi:hypothetical protein